MGKASSSKKVARIAGTGGGRTARGRTPWLWYTALTLFVALGVSLVVSSRNTLDPDVGRPNFEDHWHMAYGIFVCDQYKPPMPQPANLIGLHTHTDGLIHVEPNVGNIQDTGDRATVGRYQSGQPDFDISESSIKYPGDKEYKNGDKCGSKEAKLEVFKWDSRSDESSEKVSGDPKKIKVEDGALVAFAFIADGTTVPKPPSAANLANPNAGESGTPPPVVDPSATTVAPADTTPTSAPPPATPTTVGQ